MAGSATPAGAGDKGVDPVQRMKVRVKVALKASDEEWGVIEPLVDRVQTAQRAASGRGAAGRGGSRSGSPEGDALQAALEADGTSTDEIKGRLEALRDARRRAAADLEQARGDLQKVLTLRQEAALVQIGILQ